MSAASLLFGGSSVGDLAQAIVALGRAAEKRRGARADLVDATDTIATAIREQLRAGDAVTLTEDVVAVVLFGSKGPRPTYRAVRAQAFRTWPDETRTMEGKPFDALIRGDAILSDVKGGHIDLDTSVVLHPATAEERAAFVAEVEGVVRLFNELLSKQATDYGTSAKKAVRLTPR